MRTVSRLAVNAFTAGLPTIALLAVVEPSLNWDRTNGMWIIWRRFASKTALKEVIHAGGLAESWETLHETAATCCRDNLSWITPSTCEAQSTHTAAGTSKWYVNYGLSKCVQDCEGTGTCGGIVSNNLDLYDSVGACCDSKLWWVPTSFCVADSTV